MEVAFGDHAIAHRDGDAIDDLGARRDGERQEGDCEDASRTTRERQKA